MSASFKLVYRVKTNKNSLILKSLVCSPRNNTYFFFNN